MKARLAAIVAGLGALVGVVVFVGSPPEMPRVPRENGAELHRVAGVVPESWCPFRCADNPDCGDLQSLSPHDGLCCLVGPGVVRLPDGDRYMHGLVSGAECFPLANGAQGLLVRQSEAQAWYAAKLPQENKGKRIYTALRKRAATWGADEASLPARFKSGGTFRHNRRKAFRPRLAGEQADGGVLDADGGMP